MSVCVGSNLAPSPSRPNSVNVHDRGEFDVQMWIATECVGGPDALQSLREQHSSGLPVEKVSAIVMAIAGAPDFANAPS